MGGMTTHILDTARGRPAAEVRVELFALSVGRKPLGIQKTDAYGRAWLLEAEELKTIPYEIVFHVGDYFFTNNLGTSFLEKIPVRFRVTNSEEHYHVPLLLSPWSYTVYRGS